MKPQLLFLIMPSTHATLQLVELDTVECLDLFPANNSAFRHEILQVGGHSLPDGPLLTIRNDHVALNEER